MGPANVDTCVDSPTTTFLPANDACHLLDPPALGWSFEVRSTTGLGPRLAASPP